MADPIEAFYNRYPYPLTEVKPNRNLHGALLLKTLDIELRAGGFAGKRILDAGCGTGQRILDVARAFPRASVRAFDIAANSIDLARRQAAADGVGNVRFEVGDILDFESGERFDVVVASGVIHHLREDVRGVRNLARQLRDDGFLSAFLLHTYGEYGKMLQRDALLTLLGDRRHDPDAGVELMRDMGFSIGPTRYGRSYPDDLSDADALSRDADSLLNPQERTYTFQEAADLFATADLDWIALDRIVAEGQSAMVALDEAHRSIWSLDVEKLLGSAKAYACYLRLERRARLRVIELVARPTGFMVMAGRKGSFALRADRVRGNRVDLVKAAAP